MSQTDEENDQMYTGMLDEEYNYTIRKNERSGYLEILEKSRGKW